jgi:hypothetical protein
MFGPKIICEFMSFYFAFNLNVIQYNTNTLFALRPPAHAKKHILHINVIIL